MDLFLGGGRGGNTHMWIPFTKSQLLWTSPLQNYKKALCRLVLVNHDTFLLGDFRDYFQLGWILIIVSSLKQIKALPTVHETLPKFQFVEKSTQKQGKNGKPFLQMAIEQLSTSLNTPPYNHTLKQFL